MFSHCSHCLSILKPLFFSIQFLNAIEQLEDAKKEIDAKCAQPIGWADLIALAPAGKARYSFLKDFCGYTDRFEPRWQVRSWNTDASVRHELFLVFGISLAFLWHLAQPPPLNPSSPPPPHRSTKPGTSPRLDATSTPCSKRRSGRPQNRSKRRAGTAKTTPPPAPSRARACTWAAPTPPGRMHPASFHPRARARVNTSNGSVACVCPSRRWLT